MFALKPQRRAALPALRSRQTQARSSSSSSSFSRSRCPLYREPTYLSFSDIVGTSYNRSQPVLLLILSAWKWNSPKFACRILHSPSPTPLESPLQAPRIPEDFQAPICACYDGWVFLGVQRPRTETRSSRRSRTADASRRGIMQIRI